LIKKRFSEEGQCLREKRKKVIENDQSKKDDEENHLCDEDEIICSVEWLFHCSE